MLDIGSFRSPSWLPGFHIPASRRQLSLLAAATLLTLLLLFTWQNQEQVRGAFSAVGYNRGPLCRQLPGAQDVVVIMKTGANEVEDKLSVHLNTTLTCYPNQVIFSDYEETLPSGQHLYDTFEYTSSSLKDNNDDFALWRKLQDEGRAGLSPSELSGTDSRYKLEDIRKTIPGWRLDKWKFLPMVNQTLGLFPDKQWYMFVEADTYLLWSNLLPYLAQRNWTDDHYIGAEGAIISGLGFAHGGSGFVLSRPALEKVVHLYRNHQADWEHFEGYWVGDYMLAVALNATGVVMEDVKPTFQPEGLGLLNFHPNGGMWCSAAVTTHHQSPPMIEDLWHFEQQLIAKNSRNKDSEKSGLLLHKDVFEEYILPRIQESRVGWDNQAEFARQSGVSSLVECQTFCEDDTSCMQYAFHPDGECKISWKIMYGQVSAEGTESGWMLDRIRKTLAEAHGC